MFIRRVVFLLSGGHGFVLTILLQMFLELFSIFFLFFGINNYIGIRLCLDSDFFKKVDFYKGSTKHERDHGSIIVYAAYHLSTSICTQNKERKPENKTEHKKQNNFDKLEQCHFRNERLGIPIML